MELPRILTKILMALTLALATVALALGPTAGAQKPPPMLVLKGTVQGTERITQGMPDTGHPSKWQGQGKIKPLGKVRGSGTNRSVGFVARGHATGVVHLSNSAGAVTLRLTYSETRGFAPLPSHGVFAIRSGTGRYVGATGAGTFTRKQGACLHRTTCSVGVWLPVTYTFRGRSTGLGRR